MYLSKKHSDRICDWDDERNLDNGIIVTLHYGWSFDNNEHCGLKGFDTIDDARTAVRESVKCECKECAPFNKG